MSRELEYVHCHNRRHRDYIRLWAYVEKFDDATFDLQSLQIEEIVKASIVSGISPEELTEKLAELDFCNAVEVRSGHKTFLIYPDWP